ncbi:chitin disaccharide deacetylase [Sediminibacillus albus]|uniref:Carbohydrate deacetylase n=1 Tax=Sediminibacillus albus TaxID=407036 RepID=A0A1G8Y5K5_9BACI|nr:chitin disaccharide deacetylase [Sediminibacillus albus]SDJ97917.1 hypothetical protein SAMN05216243_1411 [Sediminibacillus albus]
MNHKRKLIINADDFGLSPGVTAGILYAHKYGVLTSTTAMVNTEFARESLEEAKRYPKLGIGLHFVLDAGRPLSASARSLVDQKGDFLTGQSLIESANKQDVKSELEAQLHFLLEQGIKVTHLDSHHHMHLHIPCALEAMLEVAESYQLPIRAFSDTKLPDQIAAADNFHYDFYGEEHVTSDYLLQLCAALQPGVTEIMCHPAFMDTWLEKKSSYQFTRTKELEILTSSRLKEWLKQHKVGLIHYGGL